MKNKLLLLLMLLVTLQSFAQIPTTDLVAWYKFDDATPTVDDITSASFNQTGTAMVTSTDRFGNNSAVHLNGDVLSRVDMPTTSEDLTLNFWIKTNSLSPNGEIIINDTNDDSIGGFADTANWSSSDAGYMVYITNGFIRVKMLSRHNSAYYFHPNNDFVQSNVAVNDGEWHHVSILLSEYFNIIGSGPTHQVGLLTKITIDNQINPTILNSYPLLQTNVTTFNESIHSFGSFQIGNKPTPSSGNYYTSEIDDLLVYDRAITFAELSLIVGDGGYCGVPEFGSLASLQTTITTTSIAFNFPYAGTYDVAYHLNTDVFSNATIINNLSNATGGVMLNSLLANSNYSVYIREQCTNTTPWSSARIMKTDRPAGITKLYVNSNATGAANGLTWADAYTDLNEALIGALAGDEIWVAQGTYIAQKHINNRDGSFNINAENIKLRGGFSGTETSLGQRDLITNETILSADFLGNDTGNITINSASRSENAFHVIEVTQNGAVIDGFTITGGQANSTADNSAGAGIFKEKPVESLTVKNCTIKNNMASNAAGIFAEYTTNGSGFLEIENCVFDNNHARISSSFSAWARGIGNYTFNVSNSLFSNNEARDLSGLAGGGLASSAGWIRAIGNTSTIVTSHLTNNTYVNNKDFGTHSAMDNTNRATVGASTNNGGTLNLEVANCIFWNNTISGGVVANSITGISAQLGNITAVNSIDEDSFSKLTPANLTSTNNTDPLFTDAVNADFTLLSGSPAIDNGNNSAVNTTTDLLGNQRIFNTTVDMGAYEFGSAPLGVDNFFVEDEFSIYPNPTSSILNIKMNSNLKQATIYSILGAKVLSTKIKTINTQNLKPGVYFIRIENEKGNVTTKRFIKK